MQINQQLLQTIITLIIVITAALFIIYKVVKKINHPPSGCSGCSSDGKGCSSNSDCCSSGSNGCEIKALKKEIDEAQKLKSNDVTLKEK